MNQIEHEAAGEPMTRGTFRLIACPTLSHERRTDRYYQTGQTVGESLRSLGWQTDGLHARVFIDGQLIPDAEWERAEPTSGQAVVVRTIPRGVGQGGNVGKQIGMIVGMLALAVAGGFVAGGALSGLFAAEGLAMAFGSGTALANLTAGAILIGGSLALNALIAPSQPRLNALSGQGNASAALSLTGSSNQITPYARIPRLYGTHRIYPPLAARPYTEIVGSNQYLRLVYCFGYGPLTLTDIRIGETPIGQFQGVQMEIRYGYAGDGPLTLTPDDVIEDNISIKLLAAASWTQRTSETNAKELSIDVTFPTGLIQYDSHNVPQARTVQVEVDYRKVGDVSWTSVGGAAATKASCTTSFQGSHNDLTFTVRTAGANGNVFIVYFAPASALSVELATIITTYRGATSTSTTYQFNFNVINGVTTAAQLKTAIEANAQVNAVIEVAFAPGNDGTGAISLPLQGWNIDSRSGQTPFYWAYFFMAGGKDEVPTLVVTATSQTLVRRSIRWIVSEPGQSYEVRVRRLTADVEQGAIRDEVYWTVFRTIQTTSPVQKSGLCLLALRIKATDQLNGTVDTLNAIATSVLPDWNGTEWVPRPTNNPASIYRDVLQGSANSRPKADDRLDLTTIQDFHARCAAQGFTFNAVIDFTTTVKQLRQDVLAAGRGSFMLRDMKYSVLQDLVQSTPVDIITPRTTSGFTWMKRFLDLPHAFKVRFVDETNDWKQGERIVYADGYSESNATIFEETEAGLGVTNPTQVWKLKRRELAEAQLRADDYVVEIDFANLNVTRGDRVQVQHDVILAGLLTARIKTVTLNGSSEATDITFDEPLIMGAGIQYAARIRRADGVQVVQQLVTTVGEWSTVTFTTPIAAGSVPAVGDLVSFGELGRETIDCIVKQIEPGPDFTATVKLLDYAPAIQTADTAILPPYDPQITIPSVLTVPTVVQVVSDETVLVRDLDGSLESRIVISIHFSSNFSLPVSRLETQFRLVESDDDWKVIYSDVVGGSVEVPIRPVEDGETYEIRVRSVDDRTGTISEWTYAINHTVIGKTSPPPDIESLVVEGDRLRWNYPSPPRDLAGFLVRYRSGTSRDWDTATPAHAQVILTTDFFVVRQSDVQTFLVKAVDTSGNVSTNAAAVTVDFGNLVMNNVVVQIDHRLLGWPGTKTNCTVVSGDLKADSSTPYWTADSDLAWPLAAGALYWAGAFSEMTYEFSFSPAMDLLDAILKIDASVQGDWRLEYRQDVTALMWNSDSATTMWNASAATLMWTAKGNYLAWPGQVSPLLHQQYDMRLIGQSGGIQVIAQQLKVLFDVEDIEETFSDLAIGGGGTRLTLTKSYRQIVVVHADLNDDGGTAAYVKIMDKSATLGPLLQAFDSSNVATTATVDVVVQGY